MNSKSHCSSLYSSSLFLSPRYSQVLSVGEGVNQVPSLSNTSVAVGDKVLFNKYHGSNIKVDGKDYIVLKIDHCLAKF